MEVELEKTKEKMMAHQSQNIFLVSEVERVEKENELLKQQTSTLNDTLHSELSDYRRGYKTLKHKLAVISATVLSSSFYYFYFYFIFIFNLLMII